MENFEQLKKERDILQKELYKMTKLIDKLTNALLLCRQQMMPLDVAKVVDKVIEEVNNY